MDLILILGGRIIFRYALIPTQLSEIVHTALEWLYDAYLKNAMFLPITIYTLMLPFSIVTDITLEKVDAEPPLAMKQLIMTISISCTMLMFSASDDIAEGVKVDERGYIVFCPCMGKLSRTSEGIMH